MRLDRKIKGPTSADGVATDLRDADAPLAREARAAGHHRQRDGTVADGSRFHVHCDGEFVFEC